MSHSSSRSNDSHSSGSSNSSRSSRNRSGFNRAKNVAKKFDGMVLDFRKIQENIEYHRENADRPFDKEADGFYAEQEFDTNNDVTWTGDKVTKARAGIFNGGIEGSVAEMNLNIGEAQIYKNENGSFSGGAHVKSFQFRDRVSFIEAEINGPSAGADFALNKDNIGAISRLNVASMGANLGPVGLNVGMGFDTGARIGADGVEAQVLGTGFSIDRRGIEISVFGSSIGIPKFW